MPPAYPGAGRRLNKIAFAASKIQHEVLHHSRHGRKPCDWQGWPVALAHFRGPETVQADHDGASINNGAQNA